MFLTISTGVTTTPEIVLGGASTAFPPLLLLFFHEPSAVKAIAMKSYGLSRLC